MNIFSALTDKLKNSVASIKAGAPEIKKDEALAKRVAESKSKEVSISGPVFASLPSALQVKAPTSTSSPLSSTTKIAPQPLMAQTTPQGDKVISQSGNPSPVATPVAAKPVLDTGQALPLVDNRIGPKAATPFSVMPSNVKPQAALQATLTKEGEKYIKDKAAGDWIEMAATTDKIVKANKMESRKDAISEFAVDVVQAFPRAIASQVLDVAGKKEFTPDSILGQVVLGEKPVKSLFTKVDEYTAAGEKFLADRGVGKDWSKGLSVGFAPLFAAGMQSLDLLPFVGGEKKAAGVAYKVANLKTAEEIIPHLKTLFGASDNLLRPIAKTLAEVTDPKEAEKIINTFMKSDIKGLVKVVDEAKPIIDDLTDDVIKNTPIKETFNTVKNEADPGKQKKFIQTILDSNTATPELKEAVAKIPQKYEPITNAETLAKAREAVETNYSKAIDDVLSSQEINADVSAKAQLLIQKAQAEGRIEDAIKIVKSIDEKARQSGRLIQALSMWDKLTPEGMLRFAEKEIDESNKLGFLDNIVSKVRGGKKNELDKDTADFILKQMGDLEKVVDPVKRQEIVKQVLQRISDKMPFRATEMIDAYRYQNMLSSPRTQARNLMGNAFQALITRPATMAVESGLDFIRAGVTGAERERYIKDVPKYYKALINSIPNGTESFKNVWQGKQVISNTDIVPNLQQLRSLNLPKSLTVVSRLMEGSDQFFKTIIGAAEFAANKSRGMADDLALTEADKVAQYSLFRKLADPKNTTGQGAVLSSIDNVVSTLNNATRKHPTLRWAIPFVTTPMNVFKQWIEYSPIGLATLPGNIKKQEQLAKALLGSSALAVGAGFAMQDRTTWAVPKNQKDKEAFYASGRKPFSVRIGDSWVPMIYAGPFALALALPAATKYFTQDQNKALTDTDVQKAQKILTSALQFLSNQTFLEGMNNYIKMVSGDSDSTLASSLSFSTSQLIPLSGFVRYINQIIDPVVHNTRDFKESFQKDIPILSKKLSAKKDPEGNDVKRDWVNILAPYDIGKHVEKYDELLKLREHVAQQRAILAEKKNSVEEKAVRFLDGLAGLDKDSKIEKIMQLKQEDSILYDATLKQLKEDKKNRDFEIELYRGMEVGSGLRAQVIREEMDKKTPDEQREFLVWLLKNKILTDEVKKQLAAIKEQRQQKIDQ